MELRQPPCPRCGCMRYTELGGDRSECADCGLGRTSVRMTATRAAPGTPPDPRVRHGVEEHLAAALAILDQPPFPLHGLDDRWLGPRSLGGHGGSDGHLDHVCLAHGDGMLHDGPLIRVETSRDERLPRAAGLARAAQSLVGHLAMVTGTMRPEVRAAAYPQAGPADPTAPWTTGELPIGGVAHPFEILAEGAHWVALAAVGPSVVSIEARAWPIELTGIEVLDDLTGYRAGTEAQLRRFG